MSQCSGAERERASAPRSEGPECSLSGSRDWNGAASLSSLPAELAGSEGCLAGPRGAGGGAKRAAAKTPEKATKSCSDTVSLPLVCTFQCVCVNNGGEISVPLLSVNRYPFIFGRVVGFKTNATKIKKKKHKKSCAGSATQVSKTPFYI